MQMNSPDGIDSRNVLGVRVDGTSYADATARVLDWAQKAESRYVCACNVHMVMEAHDDPSFLQMLRDADLVTPDGVPILWAIQLLGLPDATRVYGPDLMLALCAGAERESVPIGLYGGAPDVLEELKRRLREMFPALEISYAHSPPFGEGTAVEDDLRAIARSGARILFVALGCPRQERWIARYHRRAPAVMVGVGAAFDFIAGAKRQAPSWLQRAGLEWAFRLATEPRRLWRRYAVHNPRYVALLARQVLQEKLHR